MVKKTGIVFLLSLLAAGGVSAQQRVELRGITDGKFSQSTADGGLRTMADGVHYTAMNKERTMIVKYDYRTGKPVDTLFHTQTARECTFDDFQGYQVSPTGHRILIWRETEPIYRRSFKAQTYAYDVRRNMVKPLNDSGAKVMIPTFSPDGRMCAYVVDNNIWVKKFD